MRIPRNSWLLGTIALVMVGLAGCGSDHHDDYYVAGPGLVGLDDASDSTAPLLTVTYVIPPLPDQITVRILSDAASDGDILYDPVLSSYFITNSPPTVFFGIDSLDANLPEYRAFLTFPLDGTTGQPIVPGDALIVSADVEVLVKSLEFASAVPTFLDLVQYPFGDLGGVDPAADFNQPPLDARPLFDFLVSDVGNFVRVDVTSLMQTAQLPPALLDFQIRFSRDMSAPPLALPSPSPSPSVEAGKTVVAPQRVMDGIVPRRPIATAKPFPQAEPAVRRR